MLIMKEGTDNLLLLLHESVRLDEPIIFPTDTIYGIGAPLTAINANKKIFEIKKRPLNMPFPIIAGSWQQAEQIVKTDNLSHEKKSFIKENKNKAVTYILPAKQNLHSIYMKEGTIAVRITSIAWLSEALERFGQPITATSVNISTEHHATNFPTAFDLFKSNVMLFIQGNPPSNVGSHIFDMTQENVIKTR